MDMPEIDNKVHREQITRQYDLLRGDFKLKMQIFVECINGFSLDAYWNAKAQAAMTEETKPKQKKAPKSKQQPKKASTTISDANTARPKSSKASGKVEIDTTRVRNASLYRAILDWRSEVARERKMPPAYIMSMKAVIGLSNLEPTMQEELLAIPGIGPKTVAEHGTDLLELVATHRRK